MKYLQCSGHCPPTSSCEKQLDAVGAVGMPTEIFHGWNLVLPKRQFRDVVPATRIVGLDRIEPIEHTSRHSRYRSRSVNLMENPWNIQSSIQLRKIDVLSKPLKVQFSSLKSLKSIEQSLKITIIYFIKICSELLRV